VEQTHPGRVGASVVDLRLRASVSRRRGQYYFFSHTMFSVLSAPKIAKNSWIDSTIFHGSIIDANSIDLVRRDKRKGRLGLLDHPEFQDRQLQIDPILLAK
jgi:hypothetical protein